MPTEEIITAYKEQVAKADGMLVPLIKPTQEGEKLYIVTKFLQNPDDVPNDDTDPEFWGWHDSKFRMTAVMLVDVYAQSAEGMFPLGHMDWGLIDDYANGGGNMHEALIPKNEYERLANQRWYDSIAFKVDDNYHQQGIGSLLLATSAVALPAIGVKSFYTGVTLGPAKKTYARFGIKKDDFHEDKEPFDPNLPIERLAKHPQVNSSIGEFVQTVKG